MNREHESMNPSATDNPSAASGVLSGSELGDIDAYWRACKYLALGMFYLRDNPLLREPLAVEHLEQGLVGHWGSDPGQSLVWVHHENMHVRGYKEKGGINMPQGLTILNQVDRPGIHDWKWTP
jgi:phosphoketolase